MACIDDAFSCGRFSHAMARRFVDVYILHGGHSECVAPVSISSVPGQQTAPGRVVIATCSVEFKSDEDGNSVSTPTPVVVRRRSHWWCVVVGSFFWAVRRSRYSEYVDFARQRFDFDTNKASIAMRLDPNQSHGYPFWA
jgi:hypothetical protein